jgi:hypothetical protein
MPYKEYKQITGRPLGVYDRRRCGLTEDDKDEIRKSYKDGEFVRSIARRYADKCSRRLIVFILHPERLKAMQDKHRKEQHWKKYHDRKALTTAKLKWEKYKIKLLKDKKI